MATKSGIREPLVDLSVKYSTVLFPFRVESLIEILPHLGFVAEDIEPQFGGRLRITGGIAKKGDSVLHITTDVGVLGIRGHSVEGVLEDFLTIESRLEQDFGFRGEENVHYYELQMQAVVPSDSGTVLGDVQRHFSSVPALRQFEEVLGTPVANFGFRLVPPGVPPSSPSWFDIRVEPEVPRSERSCWTSVIYRSNDRATVLSVARRGVALLQELANVVRRQ